MFSLSHPKQLGDAAKQPHHQDHSVHCDFVCLCCAVNVCEHDSCVCVCMRGLFFYICVCVCVCVRQAMLHYAHNAMIIHGILGTWNWMTIYFPELFPFHTRCSLLSSSNFTSISPPRLACPRSTEMCEVCVECKCEWRSGVLPCHSVWPCHTLAVWSSSDMPSGPAHQL